MAKTRNFPTLTSRRLRLRPLDPGDAPAMAALANDIDVARMTTSIPHPYGLGQAEAFIAHMEKRDVRHQAVFAIEAVDAPFMGVIGIQPGPAGPPELGYWLGRPYWGVGLATEAARAVTAWAGETWNKRLLVSGHFADNPASGQVLCKADFLYTGEVAPRLSIARGEDAPTRMMVWLA
ncbi:MAG TPA: GNAT family N-acetyltransferase [Caulobacteraceae bacterium]